jgi:hypothetical protein
MEPRLGDRLLERQPGAGTLLGRVGVTEALARPRHQPFVAPPFVQEHPEAETAFLVLCNSPKACGRAFITALYKRAPNAGDAVDLHTPIPGRDGVVHRFGKALQRLVGIRAIEREVSHAVQRAGQLVVEPECSCAPRRSFEQPLTLVEVSAVAVRFG